ncbi:MAG TPA: hypothetical protein VK066_25465 [Chloroflexota bacterium]|nr:hypothetical protein [Chloroflexota bacterium]
MWTHSLARLGSTFGLVAALGFVAAPAVHAQDWDHGHQAGGVYAQQDDHDRAGPDRGRDQDDRGRNQDDRGDRDRGDRDYHQAPPPVYVVPEQPQPAPPPIVEPVPVPVTPDVQAYVLPPLEALFPTADFADYPPELVPIGNNLYAVVSPSLFWGPDQLAAAQALAAQLDQSTPGWGATVLSGPEGYGAYLTYQAYF